MNKIYVKHKLKSFIFIYIKILIMNLKSIIDKQIIFDQTLSEAHQIEGKDWIHKAILALYVEVAELANEIQSFKYWKKNKNINQDLIKEEYADGLHFLVSFLNEFERVDEIEAKIYDQDLNKQFLKMFAAINLIEQDFKQEHIINAFAIYLGIAKLLNISDDEIEQAYNHKNEINFQRIKNNY